MTTLYVSPSGSPSGTGTQDAPFASIDQAFASGKLANGGTILLMAGHYGHVRLWNIAPAKRVAIRSQKGRDASFDKIEVRGKSARLTFSRLTFVWTRGKNLHYNPMFSTEPDTSYVTVQYCTFKGHPDAACFYSWTAEQWLERMCIGIFLEGTRHLARNNTITAVGSGFHGIGSHIRFEKNIVDGFSLDGSRAHGDFNTLRRNIIRNAVNVNANHPDGFQSFNFRPDGSKIKGLVLDGNQILENTFATRMPLAAQLQGIGMYDGRWEDLTLINNLVVVSAWHGIVVLGVDKARVLNNTIVRDKTGLQTPWIMVTADKRGQPSTDVVIRNNIMARPLAPEEMEDLPGNIVVETHVKGYLPTGPALGSADPAYTPARDMNGKLRAAPFDMGAIEG